MDNAALLVLVGPLCQINNSNNRLFVFFMGALFQIPKKSPQRSYVHKRIDVHVLLDGSVELYYRMRVAGHGLIDWKQVHNGTPRASCSYDISQRHGSFWRQRPTIFSDFTVLLT